MSGDAAAVGRLRRGASRPSLGRLVGVALHVCVRRWVGLVLVAGVLAIPLVLVVKSLTVWQGQGQGQGRGRAALGTVVLPLVVYVLELLFTLLLTAVIAPGVDRLLRGERGGLLVAVWHAPARVVRAMGTALLTTVRIAGFMLLLWIPGVVQAVVLIAAVPAASVEGIGSARAWQRSQLLVRGSGWTVFFALALLRLSGWMLHYVGIYLVLAVVRHVEASAGVVFYCFLLAPFTLATFRAVLAAVVYTELRAAKELVDAAAVAREFD